MTVPWDVGKRWEPTANAEWQSRRSGTDRCFGLAAVASTEEIYTIFEGTSEIQRLVIARAISGMRIR